MSVNTKLRIKWHGGVWVFAALLVWMAVEQGEPITRAASCAAVCAFMVSVIFELSKMEADSR